MPKGSRLRLEVDLEVVEAVLEFRSLAAEEFNMLDKGNFDLLLV